MNLIKDLSSLNDFKEYINKFLIHDVNMELSFILLDCCCEKKYDPKYGLIVQVKFNFKINSIFIKTFFCLHKLVKNHKP